MSGEDTRWRVGSFGARIVDVGPIVRCCLHRGRVSMVSPLILSGRSRPRPLSVGASPDTFALVVVVVACHSLRNCRASRCSALASKDRIYTRQWSHLKAGVHAQPGTALAAKARGCEGSYTQGRRQGRRVLHTRGVGPMLTRLPTRASSRRLRRQRHHTTMHVPRYMQPLV